MSNHMGNHSSILSCKPSRSILAPLIVIALFVSAQLAYISIPSAFAQEGITISTSAELLDNRFFGQDVLQVVVNDPVADDDATIETIDVSIFADPDKGSSGSTSIAVPETSKSSGKFEFFLAHENATAVKPENLDSINSRGVEGDGACSNDCAPIVTFGHTGDLSVPADLYEETEFEFRVGDTQADVDYEGSIGTIELDRNQYGSTSFVHVFIKDQDANLNPSRADEFTVDPNNSPNADLLSLNGGTIEQPVIFRETGDNTAVFEGVYELRVDMKAVSKSLILTLYEKSNYNGTLFEPENDSNTADEVGFTIGDSDGIITGGNGQGNTAPTWDPVFRTNKNVYKVGDVVDLTIVDQDANVSATAIDTIVIEISGSSDEDQIETSALETGVNTGIFRASFIPSLENQTAEAGSIPVIPIDSNGGNVTVRYLDNKPADYAQKIKLGQNPKKTFEFEIAISGNLKSGVDSTTLSKPTPKDIQGKELSSVSAGQQVVLSTTVVNNNDQSQPFAAIVEVRDSSGITVFLAWQTGTLNSNGRAEVGLSWTPDQAGNYSVRTFAISKLVNADILSPIASSSVTVH